MALSTITYSNKSDINNNSSVPATNKVQASDMNEIKTVVNAGITQTNNLTGKVLWTNSSPTADFASQTINLSESLDNYDTYEILFLQSTSVSRMMTTGKIKVGNGTVLGLTIAFPKYRATATTVSGSSITFDDGKTINSIGTGTTENSSLIPMYVIAYNTGLWS